MRGKRRRQLPDLGEHAIFGDEEAAELRAELAAVVGRLEELNGRVNAQFTSISAHAEISREQVTEVREEARADMERSREMLLDLIDRLREESRDGGAIAPVVDMSSRSDRLDAIEERVVELADALGRCEQRQRQMAETMSAFIDTMMDEHDDAVEGEQGDERPFILALA